MVRVIVPGHLPREVHNAPLHLFSASLALVNFGRRAYQRHSATTSLLLNKLLVRIREEDLAMTYTIEDFKRDCFKEYFPQLTPAERREFLESLPTNMRREMVQSLPLEDRLAGASEGQIRQYLDRLTAGRPTERRKPRRKR